ncbi:hypothetical protein [uncultured Methylobacterium sp.]|jgi:hypothetical protein|uniref:hypothetical protein n=1 Tax=uncultured Methylobacterium sp. TaxID=157278 RepID=UPI0026365AFB|nr:hypothetical protein [uncultured Methylobacterium sp.]
MSCRHHSASAAPLRIDAVPSRDRKWRRWPSGLPQAVNDNHRPLTVGTAGAVLRSVTRSVLGLSLLALGLVR